MVTKNKPEAKKAKPKKVGATKVKVRVIGKALTPKTKIRAMKKTVGGKPRVAIISLTSCEGCQFVLLDLGTRFLEFTETVELMDFRLIEDLEDDGGMLDLVLVEGNPVTKANEKTLLSARKRAKVLVALGNCAAMGGIPEMKNYHEGVSTIKHVYKYLQGINNPAIRELDNFVKVDFVFPGCPINGEEFLKYIPELLKGNIPIIPDQPVCVECKKAGNRCLLLDKKPCFGPMILGGCNATCPSSRAQCQGCRGLRPAGNVTAMRAMLKNMMSDEQFQNMTEIFGLRDDLEERERKDKLKRR
jgi:coenzyme F420-reducing hydrogenase gamma subunit